MYMNPSYQRILGYAPKDLLGKNPLELLHEEDKEHVTFILDRYLKAKSQGMLINGGKGATERLLYRLKDAWGNWHYLDGTGDVIEKKYILILSKDVSERIKAELEIEKARKELEEKVEERTREVKTQGDNLEKTNAALRVLLDLRERERKDLERSVLFNVKQVAEPYIEKLRGSGMNKKQETYLRRLESGLEKVISPLAKDLVTGETRLTPTQSRVADLIRFGKCTKEIAETLGISIKTVETHRHKIRKKLGLVKNKANLRSYLQHYTSVNAKKWLDI